MISATAGRHAGAQPTTNSTREAPQRTAHGAPPVRAQEVVGVARRGVGTTPESVMGSAPSSWSHSAKELSEERSRYDCGCEHWSRATTELIAHLRHRALPAAASIRVGVDAPVSVSDEAFLR